MKRIYSTLMLLAMMVAALSLTACSSSDDDEGGENGASGGGDTSYTLTVTNQEGKVYYNFPKIDGVDWIGHLTNESEQTSVWCFMSGGTTYLHIYFQPNNLTVQDFSVGSDHGTPDLNFGTLRTYANTYSYESGNISVIKNDGSHFILKFDNYLARNVKSSFKTISVNGTLEVEKERLR